jgi:hypothetical protein
MMTARMGWPCSRNSLPEELLPVKSGAFDSEAKPGERTFEVRRI